MNTNWHSFLKCRHTYTYRMFTFIDYRQREFNHLMHSVLVQLTLLRLMQLDYLYAIKILQLFGFFNCCMMKPLTYVCKHLGPQPAGRVFGATVEFKLTLVLLLYNACVLNIMFSQKQHRTFLLLNESVTVQAKHFLAFMFQAMFVYSIHCIFLFPF